MKKEINVATSGHPAHADLRPLAALLMQLDGAMEETEAVPPAGTPTDDGRGVRFDREALYAEVWASSLTKLAPKYKLSDNGLRKVCLALGIPLPGKGHWAKVAAGHVVPRTPLPEFADRTVVYSYGQAGASALNEHRAADDAWLAERLVREAQLKLEAFTPTAMRPRAVIALRAACERGKRGAEKALVSLRASTDGERWRVTGFDFSGFDWEPFARDGFSMATHDPMAMRVSADGIEQAADILAAFCQEATRRGARVAATPADRGVQLTLEGFRLQVTMREEWTGAVLKRNAGPKNDYPTKAGAGRFALSIDGLGRTPVKISEPNAGELLAGVRSGAVFERIYRRVLHARQQHRAEAEESRKWAESRAAEDRAREAREADKNTRELEQAKRCALLADAKRWDQAQLLRAYVANVHAAARGGAVSSELQAWLAWAADVADDMDPTPAAIAVRRHG